MMYGWWDGSSGPWYGMVFGPIMMIGIVALAVLVIVWLLRASGPGGRFAGESKSALDILRERFARGDIDRTEYEERRKLLSGS